MLIQRLFRNEAIEILTQATTHESLFEDKVNGRPPGTSMTDEERESYYDRWRLPEMGFRNYWYPVIRSRDLKSRPLKRRLLGEDIVFWRDGAKIGALTDRCPHRGASLANGHRRFPGSGTLSCPYHGWTFDGSGNLLACIQEGPNSVMPGRVRTKAYPVEERAGAVWVWIGDMEPVPLDEDLPACMKLPGVVNLVHFTPVWRTNWALLFDNFLDRLHPPYVHRTSPQMFFLKQYSRTVGVDPHIDLVEHGQTLEYDPRVKPGQPRLDQVDFPGLGKFPRHKWWRFGVQRARPKKSLLPGFEPGSFINGLPGYIDVVNRDHRFVQFIIPIDRDHLYNMMVIAIPDRLRDRLGWTLWKYRKFRFNMGYFAGQDHRIVRHIKLGPERLSPWDDDVVRWRAFAARNARGYSSKEQLTGSGQLQPTELPARTEVESAAIV